MKDKMNMKRIAMLLAALVILATGCNKGQKFSLSGDLASAGFSNRTDSLLLQSDAFPLVVSIPVKKGHFSYHGHIERPAAATLKAVGRETSSLMLVLEKGEITFLDGFPQGTKQNDEVSEFIRKLEALIRENPGDREAVREAAKKEIRAYLSHHPKDASAVIALMQARRFSNADEMSELIAMTSKAVQNDGHIHLVKTQIKRRQMKK